MLLYGTDAKEFTANSSLFKDAFEFYYSCLLRHGVEPSLLGHRLAYKERLLHLYKDSVYFALLRYLTGFGPFLLHMEESESLKTKFRNCALHCLSVFAES